MTTHTFTAEQMWKFVNAVRSVPPETADGKFTTEQLKKLAESIGGLNDWPHITDDPKVNFAVDCVVQNDEEPEYDEQLYVSEVEAYKATGSFS